MDALIMWLNSEQSDSALDNDKQFMRADFLLILNHMHGRLCSFNKAIIKCKSQNCGTTLAEKISTLDIDDLNRAMMSIQTGQDPKGTAAEYIKTIKASCEPIGHSAEAAKKNRRRHFAICDYLGESSLFVTRRLVMNVHYVWDCS